MSQFACRTAHVLIRCPAAQVLQAFIEPQIKKRFGPAGRWLRGACATWYWHHYDFSAQVTVLEWGRR